MKKLWLITGLVVLLSACGQTDAPNEPEMEPGENEMLDEEQQETYDDQINEMDDENHDEEDMGMSGIRASEKINENDIIDDEGKRIEGK